MKSTVPHIVQYQGSKRKLADQILKHMPRRFDRLIEPFAGMAAVSIAVAYRNMTDNFIINDINPDIVSILQSAIESPEDLILSYSELWNDQFTYSEGSEAHFYKVRDDFNKGDKRASAMLYLLARCVKGSVRYNSSGEFNQSPDKRRNGTSPNTLSFNVRSISNILKGKTTFYSKDFREILEMTRKGDVIYMDPPYQGVSSVRDHRYIAGLDFDEFVSALENLNRRGIDYIISYDGSLGNKKYGRELPSYLGLTRYSLNAGLSTQALYLGKKLDTFESLYVSKGLLPFYESRPIYLPRQLDFEHPGFTEMAKIVNENQYELAVARVENLLPLIDDNTPETDPNYTELVLLSNLVADYSEEHYSVEELVRRRS